MVLDRFLAEKLPKTDLHCHLDGSLRCETLIELAKKYGISLSSYEAEPLMAMMGYGRVRKNLLDYIASFEPLIAIMQCHEAIERIAYEVCEDAYLENVWHLELRFCPYLHTKKGLTAEEVVRAAIEGADRARKNFGISVGFILCGLKNDKESNVFEVAKLAVQFRKAGVVGFDLAGPEAGFPISNHLEAIYYARRNHLFITLHAGENSGPESIREAIHEAGAHRIGHGTSLIDDPDLIEYVVDHRISIEACPISNWHTGSVRSVSDHPLKKFLQAGARVSINTDNRLCSDTSITEEIMAVSEDLKLDQNEIKQLLENGFKSAFLPYSSRALMIKAFNEQWNKIMQERDSLKLAD